MIGITIQIVGAEEVRSRLAQLPNEMRPRILGAIRDLTAELEGRVIDNLSGRVLAVRSGKLRGAVRSEVHQEGDGASGRVYISGVPYARILERGGQTRPHTIVPRNARALAFRTGTRLPISKSGATSGLIFAKRVNHPGSKIPEFAYMRRPLAQMRQEIVAELRGAVSSSLTALRLSR